MLCAPSLSGESFGMVLTEAFAAATPVVASDIPGYRDVVRDGQDGVLTPPGDALALAEALRALALDPARRERMARSARERAERFAWPHVAAEALDSYEQAIATARRAEAGGRLAARRQALRARAARPAAAGARAERLPSLQPPAPAAAVERLGAGGCARCAAPALALSSLAGRRPRGARAPARRRHARGGVARRLQARPARRRRWR